MYRIPNTFKTIVASIGCLVLLSGTSSATEKLDGWGTFVDPAGDCAVSKRDHRVTFTVPGTHHDLNPTPTYNNTDAPRILQSVKGDFTIEVKLLPFPIPQRGTSNNSGGHSYCAAGLIVWQDGKNFVRWFRAANGERGDVFVHGEWYHDGKFGQLKYDPSLKNRDRRIPDGNTFLKLVRQGNRLTFYRSQDGQTWEAFCNLHDLPFDETLQVGVAAVNSAKTQYSPVFEHFKLTVPKQ